MVQEAKYKKDDIVIPLEFNNSDAPNTGWAEDMLDYVGKECIVFKSTGNTHDDETEYYDVELRLRENPESKVWWWPEEYLIPSTNVDNIQA